MMRCMKRNMRQREMWYSNFVSIREGTEEKNGYTLYSGELQPVYTEPKSFRGNIAPKSYFYNGDATKTSIYGTDLDYDRVIQVDWANKEPWNINEYSRLWIDVEPYKDGVLQPHDYEVKRVTRTHDDSAYTIAIYRISRDDQSN